VVHFSCFRGHGREAREKSIYSPLMLDVVITKTMSKSRVQLNKLLYRATRDIILARCEWCWWAKVNHHLCAQTWQAHNWHSWRKTKCQRKAIFTRCFLVPLQQILDRQRKIYLFIQMKKSRQLVERGKRSSLQMTLWLLCSQEGQDND
jgi:hypothetical protein